MGFPAKHKHQDLGIEYHPGIRIDKIPVEGAMGFLFVVATLLIFLSIPAMRGFLLITGPFGLIGAGILYFWHNQTRW